MVRLDTLRDVVDSVPAAGIDVTVFDQGPVYMLSILQRSLTTARLDGGNSRVFERYWQRTLDDWARRLNYIIVLEAPVDMLRRRTHDRATAHPVGRMTPADVQAFLDRSTRSRESVMASLAARRERPEVLRISTAELTPGDVVEIILARVQPATRDRAT